MTKACPAILLCLLLGSCSQKEFARDTISVSIEPLRYLTEQVTGGDFRVNVLVPPGSGPETYEPTPTQMKQVARSLAYVDIGLIDFETKLENAIRENMPDVALIRVSENVPLLEGDCGHDHEGHGHGTDPHIWTSPRRLKMMAGNIYRQISAMYPDSAKYAANYEVFAARMDSLDRELQALFAGRPVSFMIFHPALGYLADDYGLTQIALENEGKEASVEHMRSLVAEARLRGITKVFYQKQFSKNTVDALARELGIEAVAIDPLAYELPENLRSIGQQIARP